jgi:tetratricopeptide (TPR) repeat protein
MFNKYLAAILTVLVLAGCSSTPPVQYWLGEGRKLFYKKEFDQAISAYEKVLEHEKNQYFAYVGIGDCFDEKYGLARGLQNEADAADYKTKAFAAYKKARKYLVEQETSIMNRISDYMKKGNSKRAGELNRFVESRIKPIHAKILVWFGQYYIEESDPKTAVQQFALAMQADPFNLLIRFYLALAAEKIPGEEERARDLWEDLLDQVKHNTRQRERYGITDRHIERAEQGILDLNRRIWKKLEEDAKKRGKPPTKAKKKPQGIPFGAERDLGE